MSPSPQLLHTLLAIGAFLMRFADSPIGEFFKWGGPVAALGWAIKDGAQGKIRFRAWPDSGQPNLDVLREKLRRRIVGIWAGLVVLGLIDAGLIVRVFVIQEIPKVGNPPVSVPNACQSALLLILMALTIAAMVLVYAQWRTTTRLDRLQ
jgi:hypothetical protein